MLVRVIIASIVLTGTAAWGDRPPPWPVNGPMPDEPVRVPPSHYINVIRGTKIFVPIQPMPWGDVNKRVAPSPEGK